MKKCCLCGKKFEGWGNNPWPLKERGVCCDKCNENYVIPSRFCRYLRRDTLYE